MDRTAGRLHAERIYRSQGPPPDSEAGQWRENRTGRSPDMTRWKSPARLRRVGMKRKARTYADDLRTH